MKWHHAWDTGSTRWTLHSITPAVRPKAQIGRPSRSSETQINWLRCGFSHLNDHLHQHEQLVDSPTCECGKSTEDTRHFLLDCEKYDTQRDEILNTIETIYKHDTPFLDRKIDVTTLLGVNPDLPSDIAQEIQRAVCLYIKATCHGV